MNNSVDKEEFTQKYSRMDILFFMIGIIGSMILSFSIIIPIIYIIKKDWIWTGPVRKYYHILRLVAILMIILFSEWFHLISIPFGIIFGIGMILLIIYYYLSY